jgi:hypothetical protein
MATEPITIPSAGYRPTALVQMERLRADMEHLRVGQFYKVTLASRYSARCVCQALVRHCRIKLGYKVETHRDGNVFVIKRNK